MRIGDLVIQLIASQPHFRGTPGIVISVRSAWGQQVEATVHWLSSGYFNTYRICDLKTISTAC
jgi:hypothetical protein